MAFWTGIWYVTQFGGFYVPETSTYHLGQFFDLKLENLELHICKAETVETYTRQFIVSRLHATLLHMWFYFQYTHLLGSCFGRCLPPTVS